MKEYIVYLRSWPKKGRSSVDVATQKEEAARFISFGAGEGPGRIVGEYTDRETHRRGERPELAKAIEHAIRAEATLVIVHLGRLGRNVPVTRMLLDSQVAFRCLDRQEVNPKTIHIVANMAEEETRKVSDRSKAALAAARARGVKLGSHDPRVRKANYRKGTFKAIKVAAEKRKVGTRNAYAYMMPEIKARRERGETLPEIVEWLNSQNYTTTAGKPFTQTAVWRLLDRYLGKEYLGSTRKKTTGCKVGVNNVNGRREAS